MRYIISLSLLIVSSCLYADKEIAITIDDLPFVASRMNTPANIERTTERFNSILDTLVKYQVPATGFVIAGAIGKDQWSFLEAFSKAGFVLGNHTYSHFNLDRVGSTKYIADIAKADKILTPIISQPKYFRYPYLAEGRSKTKQTVLNYLLSHHYTVAPVTIDSKDFYFNETVYKVPYRNRANYIQKLKPKYLAYIWKQTLNAEKRSHSEEKQILLLHSNLLNSYLLGDVLEMYKENGYKFISLSEALQKPAPPLDVSSTISYAKFMMKEVAKPE